MRQDGIMQEYAGDLRGPWLQYIVPYSFLMQDFCIGLGGLSFDMSHVNLKISLLLLFDMDYRLTLRSRAQTNMLWQVCTQSWKG